LDENWRIISRQKVQGLENNETIADVIAYLRSNGCLFVAFGSVVRDAMLGEKARNVDGVISCEMKKVRSLCLAKYGRKSCGIASGMMDNTEVVIGNFQSLSDRYQSFRCLFIDSSKHDSHTTVYEIEYKYLLYCGHSICKNITNNY
jgi:hypothetical protein